MNISQKGLAELVGHEGMCLRPYKDSVGVWTIGVGSTISEGIDISKMNKTEYVSVKFVMDLFHKGIVKYENAINKALKVPVTQEQFDALVSVCYNIGCAGASNSTFMKRINAGDSAANVAKAIMMWLKPIEIKTRRAKEALLYERGIYSNRGKALQFDTNGEGRVSYHNGKMIDVVEIL